MVTGIVTFAGEWVGLTCVFYWPTLLCQLISYALFSMMALIHTCPVVAGVQVIIACTDPPGPAGSATVVTPMSFHVI